MEDPDNLQGPGLVPVDNQVGVNQEQTVPLVGDLFAPWPMPGILASLAMASSKASRTRSAASMLSSAM